jgi:UDP-N-acetylmuramoyl-tripeptide--D-alanyl-D-alanine ligase
MNHPGEIPNLADMVQASVAVVNNAQREHQEFMATVEAVAQENGCAIAALASDGVAVFPAHDDYSAVWQELAGQRKCIRFSMRNAVHEAEVCLLHAQWEQDHWHIKANTPEGELTTQLHIAGRHNISNALAATAAALAAGVSLSHIALGLNNFEPVKGRSRAFAVLHEGRAIAGVDDTYNANPDSVLAAIDVLAELPMPRVLVLGDMGEVGEQGPQFHQEVGRYAKDQGIDHVLCLGDLTHHTTLAAGLGAEHFDDIAHLNARLTALLPKVSSVLVKGSRSMKMERVVQTLEASNQTKKGTTSCC